MPKMAGYRATRLGMLLLTLAIVIPTHVSGSHFRYGTLFWELRNQGPSANNMGAPVEVDITLLVAYRRDYSWGENFGEQWYQSSGDQRSPTTWYGSELSLYRRGELQPPAACVFDITTSPAPEECFTCPESEEWTSTASGTGCIINDPQFDLPFTNSNNNSVMNEGFFLRLPSVKQNDGSEIIQCPTPFYCDAVLNGVDNTEQMNNCEEWRDNLALDPLICAPWSEVYGMFMGDGSSTPVELTVTSMVGSDKGYILGNYLIGKGEFSHVYSAPRDNPFIAYFTGGDRVYECNDGNVHMSSEGNCELEVELMLNNNAEGRFRLETAIWLGTGHVNRSPRVSMIPVIPLPRGTAALPRSRFQVIAYDPDGDRLNFRFGDVDNSTGLGSEYGGITKSKLAADFSRQGDRSYGNFNCDENIDNIPNYFIDNNSCPPDRVPVHPTGALTIPSLRDQSSFTSDVPGLIEWDTFNSPPLKNDTWCPSENAYCTKLRSGLYNFVVMVEDLAGSTALNDTYRRSWSSELVWMSKVPVDFMAYLYDGPMFYCGGACQAGDGTSTWSSREGEYGGCAVCGLGPGANVSSGEGAGPCAQYGEDGVTVVPCEDACVQNQPPRFQPRDPGVKTDTPGWERWSRANAAISEQEVRAGVYSVAELVVYKGDVAEFNVTAVDDDECTELTLDATSLPSTATLAQAVTSVPSGGAGTMVQRLFKWEAPQGALANEDLDTREAKTLVCFNALDGYFATADPFYCVSINILPRPSADEEVLLRFDCKLSLLWSPAVQRFVFAENTPTSSRKLYTVCRYENHMWHHAMVTLDEEGLGRVYVDGELAELMELADTLTFDLTKGFQEGSNLTEFTTQVHPNYCGGETGGRRLMSNGEEGSGARRSLQALYTHGLNVQSDQPVSDFFAEKDSTVTSDGSCCSFTMGARCREANEPTYRTFAGLLDEVAVWNRALRPEEVKDTLFKMPQKTTSRQMAAPRGVQVDYTAGRVLYTRFNNPCMESPPVAPPPPFPPPSPCLPGEGLPECPTVARRLQQISDSGLLDGTRRFYVADKAGYTAGETDPTGGQEFPSDGFESSAHVQAVYQGVLDRTATWEQFWSLETDAAAFRDFPTNAKYAFTGVPWEPPFVYGLSRAESPDEGMDPHVPIDGGHEVHVSGIGFARSAFSKCVVVQPDPQNVFGKGMNYEEDVEELPPYDNYFYSHPTGSTSVPVSPYTYISSTQVIKTPAYTVFREGNNIPNIGLGDFHHPTQTSKFESNEDTREGEIPAFQYNLLDPFEFNSIFGGWEVMRCDMPEAAFPSKDYMFAVSNDAGITGSPPSELSFVDYSIWFDGRDETDTSQPKGSFSMTSGRSALGESFTMSFWMYPTNTSYRQSLVEMGSQAAVIFEDGAVKGVLGNQVQSPSMPAAVDMWHHVIFVADGGSASLYVDLEVAFQARSSGFTPGFPNTGPSSIKFANIYHGYLDEIKMWSDPVTLQAYKDQQLAYTRLSAQSEGTVAYYRFNHLSVAAGPAAGTTAIPDFFGEYDLVGEGTFEFRPMAVPWEPSTVYSINEVDALREHHIMTGPVTGMGKQFEIEGFNFAKSFSSGCHWGAALQMAAVPSYVPSVELQPSSYPACIIPPTTDGEIIYELLDIDSEGNRMHALGEGTLGRPDNKSSFMLPYPAMYINANVSFTEYTEIDDDNQRLVCAGGTVSEPGYASFSAGNVPTLNVYPFEFTEVALLCDGDNYLSADEVCRSVGSSGTAGRAYTMGAWVFPHPPTQEEPAEEPPEYVTGGPNGPEEPPRGAAPPKGSQRSLLSAAASRGGGGSDKQLRRRLMHHGGAARVSTVLAFEADKTASVEGKIQNSGLIMYDGERFFYFDDCIQDVTQTGEPAAPGEWHFVMVSINTTGEGVLNVDGVARETFTTTCKPASTGMFSICQDYVLVANTPGEEPVKAPSSMFHGRVDEVMIFNRFMSFEMMSTFMFKPHSVALADSRVAYFPFDDPQNMLPYNARAYAGAQEEDAAAAGRFVESSGPWLPATVVAVEPERLDVSARQTVSVFGTNFAPSQWLRVNFGGASVEVAGFLESGVTAVTAETGRCDEEFPATVSTFPSAPTPSAQETVVMYTPTVGDLDKDLVSRFTFDYVRGVTHMDSAAGQVLMVDLAAAPPNVTAEGAPRLEGTPHMMMPVSKMVSDKDLFTLSAVQFDAQNVVALPAPDSEDHTVCVWVLMFINEQLAPLAGAWKLVCLVSEAGAAATVYVNTEPQAEEVAAWYRERFGDMRLGDDEQGFVGDVWVYARALTPCEIAARYFTQEYALDFVKGRERLLERPAHVALPLEAGPLRFTLEMWIYAYHTSGVQTIASTDSAEQALNTLSRDLGLHFGLNGNSLFFAIHKGCGCQPCEALAQMVSWRSKVFARQWTHVSFVFPFAEESRDLPTMAIHVDGVLRDVRDFPNLQLPELPAPTQIHVLLGQAATYEPFFEPFEGLVYDVRWTNASYYAPMTKKTTQCPPLDRGSETYYALNEGGGALGGSGGAVGLAGLWTNTSYDDATSPLSTTFYPFDYSPNQIVSGVVGIFVITSRTACSKKRVLGGDNFEARIQEVTPTGAGEARSLPVVDANDGNYHVEIRGYICATYQLTVLLDGEVLTDPFPLEIVPGRTNPATTHVTGNGVPEFNSAGVLTSFTIKALDFFGCDQRGHDDRFVVTLDGPMFIEAHITPLEGQDGMYRVAFVPEAPGDYHMTMYMIGEDGEPVAIREGMYFCRTVPQEGSLRIGSQGVEVVEDGDQLVTDLDLGFPGITMEMWFKIPVGFSPTGLTYLLHKGGFDQFGNYTKTYDLVISESGELSASIYAGLGDIRTAVGGVEALLVENVWHHVAAVYDGNLMLIFLNGQVRARSPPFSVFKPVKQNSYLHPLEIGTGLQGGYVDEVKLWKVARTQAEIQASMYCAPYQHLEHVAAYFSFNEGTGQRVYGHGDSCRPMSEEALSEEAMSRGDMAQACLVGTLLPGAEFSSDTPMTLETEGYNAASSVFSTFYGPGLSEYAAGSAEPTYTIMARDKCDYAYTRDDATAFAARTREYAPIYWDLTPPFEEVEYPILEQRGELSEKVYAMPSATRRCPGDAQPETPRGDEFVGYFARSDVPLSPTTTAGTYMLHLEVDDVLAGTPKLISVVANVPAQFYVAPTDQGMAAGVASAFKVQMKDRHDNTIYKPMRFSATITLSTDADGSAVPYTHSETIPMEDIMYDDNTGYYTVLATVGFPGSYTLLLTGLEDATSMSSYVHTFSVRPGAWRKLLTDDLKVPMPTRRFEHSSAVYNGDIYIFGGAQYDRTYLNDMYVLRARPGDSHGRSGMDSDEDAHERPGPTVAAVSEQLAWMKTVTFDYVISEERDITLEVRVDTAELIAANRMNPTCLDVVFTLPNNGEELDFYLDPIGEHPTVPGRCNSNATLYFVKLPAGTVSPYQSQQMIEMYYGNPTLGVFPHTENEYNLPESVFYMYEGFERGSLKDSLFEESEACTQTDTPRPDIDTPFAVRKSLPYAGQYSLSVTWGGVGVLVAMARAPVSNYKLRAWFYDSAAANSSHFVSPDFGTCGNTGGGHILKPEAAGPLEAISTAVGTYTLSHGTRFCVASPWESTIDRYAGWHLFEVTSTRGRTTVTIDNQEVKSVPGENALDRVLLNAGFAVDDILMPGLNLNHAFWDEISVVLVEPGVGQSNATSMAEDVPVSMTSGRSWYKLETKGPSPPPRFAHSSVVYNGTMYVYGGERSAYTFNDVWAFDFANSTWSFVTPQSGELPPGRYDHTASVTADGRMIVLGGRDASNAALGDIWAFNLHSHSWSRMAQSTDMGTLFSHAATIPGNATDMYVFGGYSEGGFTAALHRCDLGAVPLRCYNITHGCGSQDPSNGWLPDSLKHRYEHTAFADDRYMYIYGGASRSESYGFGGVYKFTVSQCYMEEIPLAEGMGSPVARYEHVAGLIDGGFYVQGGHAGGDYFDDTFYYPV